MIRRSLVAAAFVALVGCAAPPTRNGADVQRTINPEAAPQQNVTDFTEALACMDGLMLRFGVTEVAVLVEELQDKTQKLNAGTRDMLVSAVSDMTRRSRAIRLVTFGTDTNNIVGFKGLLENRQPFALVPKYDIRGAITQFDEEVARDQADLALPRLDLASAGAQFSISGNRNRQFGAIALDLSVIHTSDLTLVPGVSSKNLVVLTRDTSTSQASAAIRKIGINFTFTVGRTEGPAQALRTMVELATVELFGKLLRLPYWECLQISPENPRVQRELDDWFFAKSRNNELIGLFQDQLRHRGLYDGPIDNAMSPALERAIAGFRRQVALAPGASIDRAAYAALLHQRVGPAPLRAASAPVGASSALNAAAPAGASSAPNAAEPVATVAAATPPDAQTVPLRPRIRMSKPVYRAGENVSFEVQLPADGYLYCYLQDMRGHVRRIFPNRFQSDARVSAGRPLSLPGAMRFALQAEGAGQREKVACVATARDVAAKLPAALRARDFERLEVGGLEELHPAFIRAAGVPVAAALEAITVASAAASESGGRASR